jgi:hypothetical protein
MQSFHHLRSPSRHTTFVRLRQHLRQKSRRDKPSRYDSFEQLHLGHPTFVEASGPPPPSVRLRQHLRRISRRDKPSRYGSLEKLHFGHTTRRPSGMIGLWARPIPSHHLGSSIGRPPNRTNQFKNHVPPRPQNRENWYRNLRNLIVRGSTIQILHIWVPVFS